MNNQNAHTYSVLSQKQEILFIFIKIRHQSKDVKVYSNFSLTLKQFRVV